MMDHLDHTIASIEHVYNVAVNLTGDDLRRLHVPLIRLIHEDPLAPIIEAVLRSSRSTGICLDVGDDPIDHASEESNVRAGADGGIKVHPS